MSSQISYKANKSRIKKKLSFFEGGHQLEKLEFALAIAQTKGDEKKPKSKRGRYLPKNVRKSLTPAQKAATNRKKRKAGGVGSRAKYSKKIKKAVRRSK